ncbi:MAG: hypothetical protein QW261_12350 [Candidatus Jordarchaeaceae archaeon]
MYNRVIFCDDREVKGLESRLQSLRSYLKKYFKLMGETALKLYFRGVKLEELSKIRADEYFSDYVLKRMVELKEGISLFVSFFSDYVKAATVWFELFCGLVRALGTEDFLGILSKQVELDDVVNMSKIDEGYLKFQVKSSLELYLQEARFALLSTYKKARDLPKVVYYTRSEFAERLIKVMEEQNEDWLKILGEIYSFYENVLLKEDLVNIVEGLKRIIRYFIEMAQRLQIVQEFIIPNKSWRELLLEDIQKLGRRIEEIQEEIALVADYQIKLFEHGFNASIFLLRVLWGNEKLANAKIEAFARATTSTEELLPTEFNPEDLAFGVMVALEEFNTVDQAVQALKEKIGIIEEAAQILGSRERRNFYEDTAETLRVYSSSGVELYETLLDIQDLLVKNTRDKK